jgi:hypothetical protein
MAGRPDYGIGIGGKFGIGVRKVLKYSALAWYNVDGAQVSACFRNSLSGEQVGKGSELRYYRKLSEQAELGGCVAFNWDTKLTTLVFGGLYRPFENGVARGCFDSAG